jgi:signal transduction histidine kinase
MGGTLPLALPGPAAAAIVVAAANLLSAVPFDALTFAGVAALLLAGYRLGRSGPELLAVGVAMPFLLLSMTGTWAGGLTVAAAALTPAAALTGAAVRRREETREHHAVREDILGTLLEHTARGERARIARELHDVVAHHVSLIAVQAETARLTTPGMPAAGAGRLLQIGDTARLALTEMRRLLGVLRDDTAGDAVDLRPQPGLRELNELLDEARATSGAATRLILSGSPDTLDPGVELAAYRIVQEALTNARRHAPGAAVDVELRYTDSALMVRIRDNGPGPASTQVNTGHGLLGMRERAAAVGGLLQVGAAAGGGFLVETTLPTASESSR